MFRFYESEELVVDVVSNENGKIWLLYTPSSDECIDIEDSELTNLIKAIKESEE